jgi:hypothetical protein
LGSSPKIIVVLSNGDHTNYINNGKTKFDGVREEKEGDYEDSWGGEGEGYCKKRTARGKGREERMNYVCLFC